MEDFMRLPRPAKPPQPRAPDWSHQGVAVIHSPTGKIRRRYSVPVSRQAHDAPVTRMELCLTCLPLAVAGTLPISNFSHSVAGYGCLVAPVSNQ